MTPEIAKISSFQDLEAVLRSAERPVLLVEGIRALPDCALDAVAATGRWLAQRLPTTTFRSGNAEGTDTALAGGVTSISPERMEYIGTHAGMGRQRRHRLARFVSLAELDKSGTDSICRCTVAVSPVASRLVESWVARNGKGPLAGKAQYLLRDTLKVIGDAMLHLEPATAGLFYVNPTDPLSGGTGHTIRVCLDRKVPVVMQSVWQSWAAQ